MGLAERRLAEEIKKDLLPPFLADLQAAMGFAPEVEIDWASFIAYDEYPLNRMKDAIFNKLVEAMQNIGQDAMGKEALAANIRKIVIKNVAKIEELDMTLNDKVLSLASALAGDTYASNHADDIIRYLEPKL